MDAVAEKQVSPQIFLAGTDYSGIAGTEITRLLFTNRKSNDKSEPIPAFR